MAASVSHPLHFKGVKELVDSGVSKLPNIYVRPEHERPSAVSISTSTEFPVVDLSQVHQARSHITRQIGQACKEWGFFQVVNHGVPCETMDKMLSVGNEFHSLPNDYKMRYFSTDPRSKMRYATSFNVVKDKVLNWRDFLRHDCRPLSEIRGLLPDEPEAYRDIMAEYSTYVGKLGQFLLEIIFESLGLPEGYVEKAFGREYSQIMGLNYYPACPQPELTLGLTGHTDPGSITILMQDQVGGLQVLHDETWYLIKPIKHALVVNIADQLQIVSNDRYKSIQHRVVVNGERARLSVPNALGPAWNSVIEPASELVDKDGFAAFKAVKYEDYMLALQSNELKKSTRVLDSVRI